MPSATHCIRPSTTFVLFDSFGLHLRSQVRSLSFRAIIQTGVSALAPVTASHAIFRRRTSAQVNRTIALHMHNTTQHMNEA